MYRFELILPVIWRLIHSCIIVLSTITHTYITQFTLSLVAGLPSLGKLRSPCRMLWRHTLNNLVQTVFVNQDPSLFDYILRLIKWRGILLLCFGIFGIVLQLCLTWVKHNVYCQICFRVYIFFYCTKAATHSFLLQVHFLRQASIRFFSIIVDTYNIYICSKLQRKLTILYVS